MTVKRACDFVAAAVLLAVTLPVFGVYAILRLARTYNTAPAEERLALEVSYIDRASLVLDLRLLLTAVVATLRSQGNVKARGRPTQ